MSLLIILTQDMWPQISKPDAMFAFAVEPQRRVVLMRDYLTPHQLTVTEQARQKAEENRNENANAPKATQTGHLANSPLKTLATNLKPPHFSSCHTASEW